MDLHEFLVQKWEAEQPAFGRVLRAVPEGNLDYRPHERSTSAGDLAWQLAEEQRGLAELAGSGRTAWETRPRPASLGEIIASWDAATTALRSQITGLDAAKIESSVTMMMGDQAWTDTLGNMLWGFLVDMVHHRGQLSAYLRPMGGKVPSIYGPSADDPGA